MNKLASITDPVKSENARQLYLSSGCYRTLWEASRYGVTRGIPQDLIYGTGHLGDQRCLVADLRGQIPMIKKEEICLVGNFCYDYLSKKIDSHDTTMTEKFNSIFHVLTICRFLALKRKGMLFLPAARI
ncbi:hypothetical protein HNY73_016551 [Argiope bruennichi]|uniref:Uncharacterized protein n=1 Tax=Argiope bruennichi TaxID=94029 RepID=A0A8T0EMN5_ARGBR|nr:hypothetical protein HNY73_016551 [Argiope bruennichi]